MKHRAANCSFPSYYLKLTLRLTSLLTNYQNVTFTLYLEFKYQNEYTILKKFVVFVLVHISLKFTIIIVLVVDSLSFVLWVVQNLWCITSQQSFILTMHYQTFVCVWEIYLVGINGLESSQDLAVSPTNERVPQWRQCEQKATCDGQSRIYY